MKKLLFVAKDPGAANVTLPIAKRLQSTHQLYAALEGVAVAQYTHSHIPFDAVSDQPDIALSTIRPDAVVCGLSYPMNLEEAFGRAANRLGIPLIELEDFWGGHVRSRAKPDIVGVIDQYGFELARQAFPNAQVIVSGSPGVRTSPVIPSAHVEEKIRAWGNIGTTVVVPLSIDPDIALFLSECIALTSSCIVFPRLHPKCVGTRIPNMDATYDAFYRHLLMQHGEKIVWTYDDFDEVIVASDALITGYSTTMFTALQHGRMVASLWTEQMKAMVKATGGIDRIPWFEQGLSYTEVPCDLNKLLHAPPQKIRDDLRPFNPDQIIAAIRSL